METNDLAQATYDTETLTRIYGLYGAGDDRFTIVDDWDDPEAKPDGPDTWWAYLIEDIETGLWIAMIHDIDLAPVYAFPTEVEASQAVEEFVEMYRSAAEMYGDTDKDYYESLY